VRARSLSLLLRFSRPTMVRKLRHHEKKLLRRVDFVDYKDHTVHENKIMTRYAIPTRAQYTAYARLVGDIRHLSALLSRLPASDPFRVKMSELLLHKLSLMGILAPGRGGNKATLASAAQLTVSGLARRRLPVVMAAKLKMASGPREAAVLVEQGHVRVGPDVVTDSAFFVTKALEDYVTWVSGSAVQRHIRAFRGNRDDFETQ
jgi:U3 small nucleolar ribonucleoprotein protein IMP3